VDVGNRLEDPAEDRTRLRFGNRTGVDDELEKFATWTELQEDKVEVRIVEKIDQFDDPWMTQLLMNTDLCFKTVLELPLTQAGALEDFAGIIAVCGGIEREFDDREFPLANSATQFVGANSLGNLMSESMNCRQLF
jgi:hypothetical protein